MGNFDAMPRSLWPVMHALLPHTCLQHPPMLPAQRPSQAEFSVQGRRLDAAFEEDDAGRRTKPAAALHDRLALQADFRWPFCGWRVHRPAHWFADASSVSQFPSGQEKCMSKCQ